AAAHPEQLNLLVGYGTPLHLAALWGHADVVARLLALGAHPARRNQDGELPVSIAERQSGSDAAQTPIVTQHRRTEIVDGCRRAAALLRAVTPEPVKPLRTYARALTRPSLTDVPAIPWPRTRGPAAGLESRTASQASNALSQSRPFSPPR